MSSGQVQLDMLSMSVTETYTTFSVTLFLYFNFYKQYWQYIGHGEGGVNNSGKTDDNIYWLPNKVEVFWDSHKNVSNSPSFLYITRNCWIKFAAFSEYMNFTFDYLSLLGSSNLIFSLAHNKEEMQVHNIMEQSFIYNHFDIIIATNSS